MKLNKRILPSVLSLALLSGLLPTAAIAAPDTEPAVSSPVVQVASQPVAAKTLPVVTGLEIVNGKNYTQTFLAEGGKEHTIYWAQGVTPPLMADYNKSELFGTSGYFQKESSAGYSQYWINTPATGEELLKTGIFDLNKVDPIAHRPLCFLASASNLLHWWADQNAAYIQSYQQKLGPDGQFRQESGLVELPKDQEGWDKLLEKPGVVFDTALDGDRKSYYQPLSGSGITVRGGILDKFVGISDGGGQMDTVIAFFLNGYEPKTSAQKPIPEEFTPSQTGGYFHPAFGKTPLTEGYVEDDYQFYNQNMRTWLLSGRGVSISYYSKSYKQGLHAITVWGVEYDENGNLCRLYVTDSDDIAPLSNDLSHMVDGKQSSNFLTSFDVGSASGTMYLTTQPGNPAAQHPMDGYATLDLAQSTWETLLADQTKPSAPVITTHPASSAYAKGTGTITLSVEASVPVADADKNAYLSYQWYEADAPQSGGRLMPGQTSPKLKVTITEDATNQSYYCVVSNHKYGYTAETTSNVATITVLDQQVVHAENPVITGITPRASSPLQGEPMTLKVHASVGDDGTLSYQWYESYLADGGAERPFGGPQSVPTITVPTDTEGTRYYFCIVTNHNDKATGKKTAETHSLAAQGNQKYIAQVTTKKRVQGQVQIRFESNGGSQQNPIRAQAGASIALPTPYKMGYTFGGWYTQKNLSGEPYMSATMPAQDLTLYAKWNLITPQATVGARSGIYQVTYPETVTLEAGVTVQAQDAAYTYQWFKGTDFTTPVATGPTLTLGTVADSGHYSVKAIITSGQETVTSQLSAAPSVEINPHSASIFPPRSHWPRIFPTTF